MRFIYYKLSLLFFITIVCNQAGFGMEEAYSQDTSFYLHNLVDTGLVLLDVKKKEESIHKAARIKTLSVIKRGDADIIRFAINLHGSKLTHKDLDESLKLLAYQYTFLETRLVEYQKAHQARCYTQAEYNNLNVYQKQYADKEAEEKEGSKHILQRDCKHVFNELFSSKEKPNDEKIETTLMSYKNRYETLKKLLINCARQKNYSKLVCKYEPEPTIQQVKEAFEQGLAKGNDSEIVKSLLLGGNTSKKFNLYAAIQYDCSYEIINFLIEKGADVNCLCGKDNQTLLEYAFSKKKSKEIIFLLLNKGAMPTGSCMTEALLCERLYDYEVVKALIEHGVDHAYSNCALKHMKTALEKNDAKVFNFFLPDKKFVLKGYLDGLLQYAIVNKVDNEIMRSLLEHGADVNSGNISISRFSYDHYDCTINNAKVWQGQYDLRYEDCSGNKENINRLDSALLVNNKRAVTLLIEHGAKPTYYSIAIEAIRGDCDPETIMLLLKKGASMYHSRNEYGTFFHYIASQKTPQKVFNFFEKLTLGSLIKNQKKAMLCCNKRKDSIVAKLPRRLLIYLLSFLPDNVLSEELFSQCKKDFYSKNASQQTALDILEIRLSEWSAEASEEKAYLQKTIQLITEHWKQD